MIELLDRLGVHGVDRYTHMAAWGQKKVAVYMEEQPLKLRVPFFGEIQLHLKTTGKKRMTTVEAPYLNEKLREEHDEPLSGHV